MTDLRRVLVPLLVLVPVTLGVTADRSIVRWQAARSAEGAERAGRDSRVAALSVRSTLARLEARIAAGDDGAAVVERILLPPRASFAAPSAGDLAQLPTETLSSMLASTEITGTGLPLAVVVALHLGTDEARRFAAERLLAGALPVRVDEVGPLAHLLGIDGDPRLGELRRRLESGPAPEDLPRAPAFERTRPAGVVDGWSRTATHRLHYRIGVDRLLGLAVLPAGSHRVEAGGAGIPELAGLRIAVPAEPGYFLVALRLAVWLAATAGVGAVLLFRRAAARERSALETERRFLAGVTHELRTPLAAIRLLGENLSEGRGDAREYGRLVAAETERLSDLVEKALDASRFAEKPRFTDVDPEAVVRSALELVRPRAERRGFDISLRLPEPLPVSRWDRDAVRRAVVNLLDNAMRHGAPPIELAAVSDGVSVRIRVSDAGAGIAAGERRNLFRRFARGESAGAGTGLGLFLVEQTARGHGGSIDVDSLPGSCTFRLDLPVRPPGEGAGA